MPKPKVTLSKKEKKVIRLEKKRREAEEKKLTEKKQEMIHQLEWGEKNSKLQLKALREKMKILNVPKLKEDLEIAWRTFDRAIDNKDYSISILLDALEDCDYQKRRNDCLHLDTIFHVMKTFERMLKEREEKYTYSFISAADDIHHQMDVIEIEQNYEASFIKVVTFATTTRHVDTIEGINSKNMSRLDTLNEHNEHLRDIANTLLQRNKRHLSQELVKVLRIFDERTKDKRKDFEKIRIKDEEDQMTIKRQSARIQQLYDAIRHLKNKITKFEEISKKDITDYKFENDYFFQAYVTIHKMLYKEYHLDRRQLRSAILEYNKTIEYLERCESMVEKIFALIDLSEKFETYYDKTLVYPLTAINYTDYHYDYHYNLPIEINSNSTQIQPVLKCITCIISTQSQVNKLNLHLDILKKQSNTLKTALKKYMKRFTEMKIEIKDDRMIPVIINTKYYLQSNI